MLQSVCYRWIQGYLKACLWDRDFWRCQLLFYNYIKLKFAYVCWTLLVIQRMQKAVNVFNKDLNTLNDLYKEHSIFTNLSKSKLLLISSQKSFKIINKYDIGIKEDHIVQSLVDCLKRAILGFTVMYSIN